MAPEDKRRATPDVNPPDSDTDVSPLHQPLDLRPVPDEDRDRAHDPDAGSELAADDIIYDAVAKREARERRRAEAAAEGGSLSDGIGADVP